jgi:PAS domain S-box-containing protein
MANESQAARLKQLADIVKRCSEGDCSLPIERAGTDDEIDQLADSIQRLLDVVRASATARNQAENALVDLQARYQFLNEHTPGHLYAFTLHADGSFSFPYVSEASRIILGVPPEDLMRDATLLLTLIHPDDRDTLSSSITRSAATLQPWHEELRFLVNGEERWLECISRPTLQPNGDVTWDGLSLEVTNRKRAEIALQNSHRHLDDIIDFLPDATFVIDRSGTVIAWNRSIEHMTNVPKAHMLGKGRPQYAIPFYGQARPLLIDLALVPDEEFERSHYEGVHRLGNILYAEAYVPEVYGGRGASLWATASRLCDAAGHTIGAIESIRDITDRKRTEAALKDSGQRLNDILDGTPTPQFVIGGDHRIIKWNRALEDLTGLRAKDVVGTDRQWEPFYESKRPVMADLLVDGTVDALSDFYSGTGAASEVKGAYEATSFFPAVGEGGKWLHFTASAIRDSDGNVVGAVETLEDVTERKRSEDALSESRQILQTVLDTSPIRIFWKDRDSIIRGCNKQFALDSGFTDPRELVGKSDYDMGWWQQAGLYRSDDVQVMESGVPKLLIEEPQTTPDGRTIWLLSSKTPLRDASGGVCGVLGAYMDITNYRNAVEALRVSEEKFRTMVETTSDFMWEVDRDGIYTYASPQCETVLGYAPEEVVGTRRCDLMPPEEAERVFPILRDALAAARPIVALENTHLHKNGRRAVLETNGAPIFDHKGNPSGYLGIDRDITVRKGAQEAVTRSYALLKAVIESPTNVVIFALDREYRYIAFNENHHRTMKRIWGVDIALGRCMLEYITNPADRERAAANFDRALSGESFTISEEYGDAVLERRYYEDIYNPISDESGTIIGLTVFLTDITERRRAELDRGQLQTQLSQIQKLDSIGRLAGGVAHDFNNMLSVILGCAELAMDKVSQEHPVCPNLLEIQKAATRSADLTRQLLAFARRQPVSRKVLNLNELVEAMLKMLRRVIGEDIELAWLPSARMWPVSMDPSQIDQILANLCVNARDAIAGVGRLTIETRTATVDEAYCVRHPESVPGDYVVLAVTDSGCGMDDETLGKLFEPFFTTKKMGAGTGLGLATVYGIVKQNNGFLNVDSEPGRGTTFTIYLPRHLAAWPERAPEAGRPTAHARGQESVLLVEDEAAILDLERVMLESLGYRVLTASNPGEAMRAASEHAGEIQLLITDVVMPAMNGRELAKRVVSLCPEVKLLFVSGYTGDVIAHQGVVDAGIQFIQKPFSVSEFASKVRDVLDGKESGS